MFGLFVGALGAYALFRVARYHRYGGRWGGGGWGGHGGHGGGRGFGRRWFLRGLFERLDATPGQEKVILETVESVQGVGESLRGEWEKTREAAAKSLRGESFDPATLREAWARQDQLIGDLRAAAVDGLRRVHEALEPRQRQILGEMVEGGWRSFAQGHGGHRCGGYRHGYAA